LTVRAFVTQVMSADHSCREAVARVNAWRLSCGRRAVSAGTSSYCKARARIPLELMESLVKTSAAEAEKASQEQWRWKGRSVKLIDGTTLSMPDTAANQREFPQQSQSRAGMGFPLARAVAVISLATGCVLDMALGPWKGKLTGEHALLRRLMSAFCPGDVAVADRYYDSYFLAARFLAMGVDTVFRVYANRRVDFRKGRRLATDDHVVVWQRPQRPAWMTVDEYTATPQTMPIREVRVRVARRGFRVKELLLTTTMLRPDQASVNELASLYQNRWQVELDLRSIKRTMQMNILRGLTPDMVKKEVLAHLTAYNLLRQLLCEAARGAPVKPRELSFKAALQTVNAHLPWLCSATTPDDVRRAYQAMLQALRRHRVANRPGRNEPRAIKRRPMPLPMLTRPRQEYPHRRSRSGNAA
jgi:hypothetical protein